MFTRMRPSISLCSALVGFSFALGFGCSPAAGGPVSTAPAQTSSQPDRPAATASAVKSGAASSAGAGPFRETIVGLEQGTEDGIVVRQLGAPKSKSVANFSEASGTYLAEWGFGDGVSAMMEGANRDEKFEVKLLVVLPPSKLKTAKGIGIGSTRKEVDAAYGDAIDKTASTSEFVLVGEQFGGLKFRFDRDAKVTSMALGSDGE